MNIGNLHILTLLLTIVGIALNVAIVLDIFRTLFAPGGTGGLTGVTARLVWRAAHRLTRTHPARLALAGPVATILIIVTWVTALVLGWAAIYYPHLPEKFLLATGLRESRNADFLDAVYVSVVTLATLGYGEITPLATWLRLVAPLESLFGFVIFTASISWIMSIQPSLARRRQLAREVALLTRSAERMDVSIGTVSANADGAVLQELARQVVSVRNDFVQFPITYYFRDADPASSLAMALPKLLELARDASGHSTPPVRANAMLLFEALADLSAYLGGTWLGCEPETGIEEVIAAYAADHLHSLTTTEA